MSLLQNPQCRNCVKLDGKVFKVEDMVPGENAAPMHPWCHCPTGARFSEDEKDARLIVESHKSISEVQSLKLSKNQNQVEKYLIMQ
ncbi:phage minor head protein [Streptococcus suis]